MWGPGVRNPRHKEVIGEQTIPTELSFPFDMGGTIKFHGLKVTMGQERKASSLRQPWRLHGKRYGRPRCSKKIERKSHPQTEVRGQKGSKVESLLDILKSNPEMTDIDTIGRDIMNLPDRSVRKNLRQIYTTGRKTPRPFPGGGLEGHSRGLRPCFNLGKKKLGNVG